jgi:hypothetical protein
MLRPDITEPQNGSHAKSLLAAEGALFHHDSPFASLFLTDHDTLDVIRE